MKVKILYVHGVVDLEKVINILGYDCILQILVSPHLLGESDYIIISKNKSHSGANPNKSTKD